MAKKKDKPADSQEPAPKKRGKQGRLPGMERDNIPELETAAEAYVVARDARMAYTKTETQKRDKLSELMHKHGLKKYETDDEQVVELDSKEKLKVNKKKERDDL